MITCQEITKSYGEHVVLASVNLDVRRGETYGLLGPNGAGKTTTFKLVLGLEDLDSGRVLVGNRDVDKDRARFLADVGYVPEVVPVEPRKTARQNLRDVGRLYDVASQELEDRIPELLSFVGLSGTGGDRVTTFSKGMRQRLGIARSLLHRPDLLLLDEPFSGLDPEAQRELRRLVETLASEGLALLIATHRLAEASEMCDRVGILHEGRLRQEVPLDDRSRESIHANFLAPVGEEVLAAVNDLDGVGAVERGNGWARILADDDLGVSQVRSILQGKARLTRYRSPKRELEGLYDRVTSEGSKA
ncbi:hypothetical protein BRD56_09640 [Thermoplasmatales archaeon SW_10_69_26]|nr:MAG: hypothetical protein BRD56_09640 [Thermoplasmatales archaeon SW_10_69_26]